MNNLPAKMRRIELVKDLLLHHFPEEAIAKKLNVAIAQVRRDNLAIKKTQDKDIVNKVADNLINIITSASFFRTKELYDLLADPTTTTNQKVKVLEVMRGEEEHWINICSRLGYAPGDSNKPLLHLHQNILNVGGGTEKPNIDKEGKPILDGLESKVSKLSALEREDVRIILEQKLQDLKLGITDAEIVEVHKDV